MIEISYVILGIAALSCFAAWVTRDTRQWSDNDYYSLVQKYSDAGSALTSMKAGLDKIQEQLELSEDIRYALGMENARLAKEIEVLKSDIERGEEVRFLMTEMLDSEINLRIAFSNRLMDVQRSLRIARHKEFKRWKRLHKRLYALSDGSEFSESPASLHSRIAYERIAVGIFGVAPSRLKKLSASWIAQIRTMDPYPLP